LNEAKAFTSNRTQPQSMVYYDLMSFELAGFKCFCLNLHVSIFFLNFSLLLKHYAKKSALKVVYNSLIQPYLIYPIINWELASKATIQPLNNLQNKAIKLRGPTKETSLEESFQHLNILCLPKLYTLSVGKFVHSYYSTTNYFHIILITTLFQSAQFILTPQDHPLLTTCFYRESTPLQENVPL